MQQQDPVNPIRDASVRVGSGPGRHPVLVPLSWAFFDTEIGHKRDADSYRLIADALDRSPTDIVFLSDVVEELDAARDAGMQTVLLDRREDYPRPRGRPSANSRSRVNFLSDRHATKR